MTARSRVAAHLDLSTSRLKGLIQAKVLDDSEPGEMDIDAARINYIRYLRAQASGRGGDSLSRERARLASEQADRAARENKLASAQVIERQDVLTVMTAAFSAIRSRLLGMPVPALADITGPARVIDGDTIEVQGQRIRLHGIDAPEGRQLCFDDDEPWLCGTDR